MSRRQDDMGPQGNTFGRRSEPPIWLWIRGLLCVRTWTQGNQQELAGGQCTTDRHCPMKTLSGRGGLSLISTAPRAVLAFNDQRFLVVGSGYPGNHLAELPWNMHVSAELISSQITFLWHGDRLSQEPDLRVNFHCTVSTIWYLFYFLSWQRAKPRTLNRRNRSTVPVHLIDQFGFYLIPTGEVARQFLIIWPLDSSCFLHRSKVLVRSQNWAFRQPHELEHPLLQSTPATIPFR